MIFLSFKTLKCIQNDSFSEAVLQTFYVNNKTEVAAVEFDSVRENIVLNSVPGGF